MAGNVTSSPGFVNGPLYKAARFGSSYVNVPPNLHRLENAIGLTAGLFLGRKLMDIIVGETPDGTKVDTHDVPTVLRPLHGVLHYDHFSDKPADRWMKVFDRLVPAVTGAMGACGGSAYFFAKDFIKPVEKKIIAAETNPSSLTLLDAERLALYHQSKPWDLMTGASALFGSASGFGLFPSVNHYGASLGTLFAMRAERAAAPLGHLVNANTYMPFRPTKLVSNMINYAAGNPATNPERLHDYANGILKTWFRDVKEEHVEAFVNIVKSEREKFLKEGKLPEQAEGAVKEALGKLVSNVGLEETFLKIGLDPREARIGDQGFITIISRKMGDMMGMKTSQKLQRTWEQVHKGIEIRHPELAGKAYDTHAHKPIHDTVQNIAAASAIGAAVVGAGMISTAKDANVSDLSSVKGKAEGNQSENSQTTYQADNSQATNNVAANENKGAEPPLKKFSHSVNAHKHVLHAKKQHGFMNGKMLDAAEGITDMFNVINGVHSHRLYCAIGLTAGSWIGDEWLKALTGVSFTGAKVKKDEILKPFQKMYKALPFNPHSDMPHDKWMLVLSWSAPMIIGGAAVASASHAYFKDREKKIKDGKYLDEVEEKATFAQAEPWSVGAAVTSLFGGSSGFVWMPGINYMTHLGTRYSMGSGRKVSMPILGKAWSNNSTLFPFAPPGMVDMMIKEVVNNKCYNPELLETYSIGVLKPWFDKVTPEQIEAFAAEVYEIRDKFFKDGGVPENLKADLEKELKAHFKGAGLEETLQKIGLNPVTAQIANNGWSGQISEKLGTKAKIEKIRSDYVAGYKERLNQQRHKDTAVEANNYLS